MVEVGGDTIIFDHGPGSYHRMLEAGKKPTAVTHLLFSHLHYDHFSDYATLVLTRWDQGAGRIPELKVYGPEPLRRLTGLLFAEDGVFGPDLLARTSMPGSLAFYEARGGVLPRKRPEPDVKEIKSDDTVQGENWTIKAVNAAHAQPYLRCHAYRLNCAEGSFVYSGDTGPSKAVLNLAKDCDVLVHMCHYISGTLKPPMDTKTLRSTTGHLELAQLAQEANVKNLVVTHVTEPFDVPGVRERVIAQMAEIFKGNLFFGEDLMTIPVEGPKSAKLD
jgi:ribonuclease BN (tRNA processing enzyme)